MSDARDIVFKAVAEFIERETGFPQRMVQPSTTLLAEIGLDGDDAEQFFLAFAKRFGVALDGLNLSRHFGGEGFLGAGAVAVPIRLAQALLGQDAHKGAGLKPICVAQLVQAVKSKRWAKTG